MVKTKVESILKSLGLDLGNLDKRSERLDLLYENNCNNHLYSRYQNYFNNNSFKIKVSISRVDFIKMNNKEKELFYLENNIYLKNNKINPALVDDIIARFIYYQGVNWSAPVFISKIKNKLDTCIDNKEKSKLIKKEYKKYSQKLNKIGAYFDYSLDEKDYPIYYNDVFSNFIGLISHYIADFLDNFIVDYLNRINFYSDPMFKEWEEIEVNRHVLDYLSSCYRNYNSIEPVVTTQIKPLSVNQAIILVDELKTLDIDVWDNLHKTKKAKIISLLINRNEDNIRKGLINLDKTKNSTPLQFQKDQIYVERLIKDVLLT